MKQLQLSSYEKLINENKNLPSSIKKLISKLSLLVLILTVVVTFYPIKYAHAIESQQVPIVQKVVAAFKQNNRVVISKLVSYPLLRQSPLPPIRNPKELLSRYDEVFDRNLINTIVTSNIYSDWNSIGWRGVMLKDGIVSLDPAGNITEINYLSQVELAQINKLNSLRMAKGRRAMHRSVKYYQNAVVEMRTQRFHIRVDDIGNGRLRYASWPINKNTSEKPDLILLNGRFVKNGRNQSYVFINGEYSYQLNINSSGFTAKPTANLEVRKRGDYLLREAAIDLIQR